MYLIIRISQRINYSFIYLGEYCIADSDGHVYRFNLAQNQYYSIRSSTIAVSSMEYIHSRSDQLALAYNNGLVIIVDTVSGGVISNIQNTNGSAIKLMKCHPTKPMLITASAQGVVSIWDLRDVQCTRSLALTEGIIDIQFELDGELIAIVLENTGVYIYRSSDCQLICHCSLPSTERKPNWVAYASTYYPKSGNINDLRFILSGDNGNLYTWSVGKKLSDHRNIDINPIYSEFLGVLELPSHMPYGCVIAPLGDENGGPRLGILSNECDLIIVDIEGPATNTGLWTIVADLRSSVLYNKASSVGIADKIVVKPFIINSSAARAKRGLRSNYGVFVTKNDFFVAINDHNGSASIHDTEIVLGSGALVGQFLRSRGGIPKNQLVKNTFVIDPKSKLVPTPHTVISKDDDDEKKKKKGISAQDLRKKAAANGATPSTMNSKINKVKEANSVPGVPKDILQNAGNYTIFELAKYAPADKRLSAKKLKTYLAANGEYPERHRAIIWRYLLRLPENTVAYSDLVRRGVHPTFTDLFIKYPVRQRRIFNRLQNICSQLGHWTPIMGELSYLPSLCFPFLLVYNVDEQAALETVMTILMWWGYSWHVTFPNPPVHICDSFSVILKMYDSKLHSHLLSIDASPAVLGWMMLSTLFTEVLSKSDWLKFMDYIFTNFERIGLSLLAPVAILMNMKDVLMDCQTSETAFLAVRKHIDTNGNNHKIVAILKSLDYLLHATSAKYLTAVLSPDNENANNLSETDKEGNLTSHRNFDMDEAEQVKDSIARSVGFPIWPLPKGRYPAYDGRPKTLVNWQLDQRDKAMSLNNEAQRRDDVMKTLERKFEQLNDDNRRWMDRHQSATQAEMKLRNNMLSKEKEHLLDLVRIEEDISKQRAKLIRLREATTNEEVDELNKVQVDASNMISTGELHMKETMDLTFNLHKLRELSMKTELEAHERMKQLHLTRSQTEWNKSMEDAVNLKTKELDARDMYLSEKYKLDLDNMAHQRTLSEKRAKFLNDFESKEKNKEEMMMRMQKLILERESKMLEIERTRALRLATEQKDEALLASKRSIDILMKREEAMGREQDAVIAENNVTASHNKVVNILNIIQHESSQLLEEEMSKMVVNTSTFAANKEATIKQALLDLNSKQLSSILMAEKELASQLDKLKASSQQVSSYASNVQVNVNRRNETVSPVVSDVDSGNNEGNDSSSDDIEALITDVMSTRERRSSMEERQRAANDAAAARHLHEQQKRQVTINSAEKLIPTVTTNIENLDISPDAPLWSYTQSSSTERGGER